MVLRSAGIDFAGGALVYPGGKSDPADLTEETAAYCDGVDGLDLVGIGNRVCGIRETFEEAGFLLAREKGRRTLVSGDRCLSLGARYRKALHSGDLTMKDLAVGEDLTLACDLMVPFARWITPARSPKRFDTWFFLAPVPEGQSGSHDQEELSIPYGSPRMRPSRALLIRPIILFLRHAVILQKLGEEQR